MSWANSPLKAANIKYIVAHCSAGPRNASADSIRRYHEHEWPQQVGMSYAYFIEEDGAIVKGRDELSLGFHVGNLNSEAIGFCAAGGVSLTQKINGMPKPEDNFTDAQRESIAKVALDLLARYPKAKLIGHNQVANKACPVYDVHKIVAHFNGSPVKTLTPAEGTEVGRLDFWKNIKNFNSSEFEIAMDDDYMLLLDAAREKAGFPFVIRTALHSECCEIRANEPRTMYDIVKACMDVGLNKIGVGKGFIRAESSPAREVKPV